MKKPENILTPEFYANPDVVDVSRNLIGKLLCTHINGKFTSGIITESEAYCGRNDKACHAYNGLRTNRTEIMYGDPGNAYIYLCYGIHHLFNIVTNRKGLADAVLIRSVVPVFGTQTMNKRRNFIDSENLTNGPGKLTQAMGITTDYNSVPLTKPPIWIEDRPPPQAPVLSSPRIGVNYAGEDAKLPWRFYVDEDKL